MEGTRVGLLCIAFLEEIERVEKLWRMKDRLLYTLLLFHESNAEKPHLSTPATTNKYIVSAETLLTAVSVHWFCVLLGSFNGQWVSSCPIFLWSQKTSIQTSFDLYKLAHLSFGLPVLALAEVLGGPEQGLRILDTLDTCVQPHLKLGSHIWLGERPSKNLK